MAKDILKEAIADAKAVREVALANAKAALEEAFTPKLQSMLSAKLAEELDEEINEEEETNEAVAETTIEEDSFEEAMKYDEDAVDPDDEGYYGKSMEEEIDLEEILAELELEESEEVSEDTVAESEEETVAEGEEEIAEGEEETVAEGEETVAEGEEELAEGEEELEEAHGVNPRPEDVANVSYGSKVSEGEEFDLDALLEELDGLDEAKDEVKEEELEESKEEIEEEVNPLQSELEEAKNELEETKEALETVRAELNEVNLLNSKLLYVNRIFKANQLDEAQKLRVVETLDKAGTAKEAKLIYETIKDTFNISKDAKQIKKSSIKEGLGMASKATGASTAPKKEVISESNDMMTRFQKLANIKINQ